MLRKTLTILSLIGLLLSVGLWVLSDRYWIDYTPRSLRYSVSVYYGCVSLYWPDQPYRWLTPECWNSLRGYAIGDIGPLPSEGPLVTGGFALPGTSVRTVPSNPTFPLYFPPAIERKPGAYCLRLPFWVLVVLSGSVLVWGYLPFNRRRKRKKLGLCVKCGYDLRASKDRCPECGTCFEKPKRSADCRA